MGVLRLVVMLTVGCGLAVGQEEVPVTPAPPARISGGVMAGQILTRVSPVYPPEAKAQRVEGSVVLRAIISKDGTIENLSVVSGNEVLAKAAVDAVRQWTYKPYLLNGVAADVDTTVTVNFSMGSGGPARISGGVMSAALLTSVPPSYPREAKEQHVSGTVILQALIGKDGLIMDLQVVSGPDLLQQAAEDAVQQWKYRPYLLNGQPVEVLTTVNVNFNLTK